MQYISTLLCKPPCYRFEPFPGLILIDAFIHFSDVLSMQSSLLQGVFSFTDLQSLEFFQSFSFFCFDSAFNIGLLCFAKHTNPSYSLFFIHSSQLIVPFLFCALVHTFLQRHSLFTAPSSVFLPFNLNCLHLILTLLSILSFSNIHV